MKCTECKNAMTKSVVDHLYIESGLENVLLRGVTQMECESCGAKRVQIPSMGVLHRSIAKAIAHKPARLVPSEVAFLRDHLDLTNREFAELIGVTPEQSSRWTNSDPIGVPAERFLRMLATMGPEAVAARKQEARVERTLADAGIELVSSFDLVETLGGFPPPATPVRDIPIEFRRSGKFDWKPEKQAN